jgi:hypothetical protein
MVQDSIFSKPVQSGHENLGQKVNLPSIGIYPFASKFSTKKGVKPKALTVTEG